ncbi:DUF1674 domain-containing protein [Qipengyuania sp.]|uniref:DUF1674 domain-containing protein n=1 Tax=Qipengyuania sp. TaxID=2004515 RepID=UPI0035C80829
MTEDIDQPRERTPDGHEAFRKPSYWSNESPPEPSKGASDEDDPQGLSPTRYGDWTIKGIAVDF